MCTLVLSLSFSAAAAADKDIEKIPSCQYCGMDREKFGATRMLVEYANGTAIGTCSIHCAAVDLAQSFGKEIKALKVADYRSGRLIDAEKAIWVIGAGLPGVMAAKSRVAFADKGEAESFRKEKGGETADFDAAITSTYCDMWPDTQAIRSRRTKH
ncbi:MAG: nitrous oxide reductase accessory protein NosL [Candidatus Methylomirabilia bacterium]